MTIILLNNSCIPTLMLQITPLEWTKFLKDAIKLSQTPSEQNLEQGL